MKSTLSKIYNFICRANQIGLFMAVILVFGSYIINRPQKRTYSPRKVDVVEQEQITTIEDKKYEIHHAFEIKDVQVFILKRGFIISKNLPKEIRSKDPTMLEFAVPSPSGEKETVNVLFVSKDGSQKRLFENDVFVTDFRPAAYSKEHNSLYSYVFEKNIYVVLPTDENEDGVLTRDDKSFIYISDYNGDKLKSIAVDFDYFKIIADNKLLIQKSLDNATMFYIYSVETDTMESIKIKNTG